MGMSFRQVNVKTSCGPQGSLVSKHGVVCWLGSNTTEKHGLVFSCQKVLEMVWKAGIILSGKNVSGCQALSVYMVFRVVTTTRCLKQINIITLKEKYSSCIYISDHASSLIRHSVTSKIKRSVPSSQRWQLLSACKVYVWSHCRPSHLSLRQQVRLATPTQLRCVHVSV